MLETIKRPFSKRNLSMLREFVRTDFKLRYQESVLGYLWSLLRPLLLFGVLYLIFTQFLKFGADQPNFAISLLLGIVLWTFFAEATVNATTAIVAKGDLIRKIAIPKYLIILAVIASSLINLFLNLMVVFVFVLFSSVELSWSALLLIPLVLQLILLVFGLSLFLSAAFVRYRDISYIWEVVLQAMFYATPIIYPVTLLPESVRTIMLMNPLAQIIQDSRAFYIEPSSIQLYDTTENTLLMLVPYLAVLVVLILGIYLFRKKSRKFAEAI